MNKYFKTAILFLIFSHIDAQTIEHRPNELLNPSKRWILINNKIEKNEIVLTSYKTAKLKANTFVLSFASGGKIEYDYETNFAFKSDSRIQYLDILTEESSWEFDSLSNQISLTIKGGYSSLEDFKFKRNYTIERLPDGYILRKAGETFYEDLKEKARLEKLQLAHNSPQSIVHSSQPTVQSPQSTVNSQQLLEAKNSPQPTVHSPQLAVNSQELVEVKSSPQPTVHSPQLAVNSQKLVEVKNSPQPPVNSSRFVEAKLVETKVAPVVAVDYIALSKDLLDKSKRWMLVKNKIERNDIFLTTYNESKLTINNLIMSFDTEGKIAYDYESDPKIKFCAGVDFLDIDTDETSWEYNAEKNIVTLTLKGGYASLDDFKFKREYWVEAIEDGYILRKQKELYFTDFRKPEKKEKKLSH